MFYIWRVMLLNQPAITRKLYSLLILLVYFLLLLYFSLFICHGICEDTIKYKSSLWNTLYKGIPMKQLITVFLINLIYIILKPFLLEDRLFRDLFMPVLFIQWYNTLLFFSKINVCYAKYSYSLVCLKILSRIKRYAFGRLTIPPRPTNFLVITLYIFGTTIVNDITDVRFIYAHTERYRGNHNLDFISDKEFMGFFPLFNC